MCEMFQLSLDTPLPVSRCWYESINGERWEWTAVVGGGHKEQWKMREKWMKRSEISLSASLNGQFHTCSEQVSSQSDWWVSSLKVGWRIKWFFRVTFDSETVLPIFTAECWHLLVISVFKNKWTPMVMVLHFQFGPSCLHYDQHRASCSGCLTVLLKQVSSKQALINTNANIWNGLSVTYLYFLGLIFSNCCVTSPKIKNVVFVEDIKNFVVPSCFALRTDLCLKMKVP